MYKLLTDDLYLNDAYIPALGYKKESFMSTDILYVYKSSHFTFRGKVLVACRSKEDGKVYVDMRVKNATWKDIVLGRVKEGIVFAEESMIKFLVENKTGLRGYTKRYMPNGSVDKWKGSLV